MKILILLNFLISSFMFAIILFTQIVSYPLFFKIQPSNFSNYHKDYVDKISSIVIPMMLIEFSISILLTYLIKSYLSIISLLLFFGIFFSTFFIQVPIHEKIKFKSDFYLFKKLIRTNWIRTSLWLLKCIFSFIILFKEFL